MHMHMCCVCVFMYGLCVCVYVCVQAGRLASTLGTILKSGLTKNLNLKQKTVTSVLLYHIWLVGWLNFVNDELSPKRYWQGPRSQEVGEG